MEAKKSNKIREIVKLQQLLKKWRNTAKTSKANNNDNNNNNNNNNNNDSNSNGSKSIKFLKRTLSLSETSAVLKRTLSLSETSPVPKGYLAVSVGEEQKRYTIPTEYLSHQAFHVLLREAEEEFGFQQTGVLRIPCEVPVFENILKIMEEKKDAYLTIQECRYIADDATGHRRSSDCQRTPSHHPQSPMCR